MTWETCMSCGGRCGELKETRPAARPGGIPLASEWMPCESCGGGGRELVVRPAVVPSAYAPAIVVPCSLRNATTKEIL